MVHVAIIRPALLDDLVAGRKTIESRLSLARRVPFGRVHAGERVYFKLTGGPYAATALVSHVETFENLTPRDIASIRRLFNDRILASAEYWKQKRASRFATLLWLHQVQATEMGPVLENVADWQPRSAWGVLSEAMDVYPPLAA